jgi:hypothetical protein
MCPAARMRGNWRISGCFGCAWKLDWIAGESARRERQWRENSAGAENERVCLERRREQTEAKYFGVPEEMGGQLRKNVLRVVGGAFAKIF